MTVEPPELLAGERVVSYAVVDERLDYVERRTLLVDGDPVGRVPRLAIGTQTDSGAALLLHCDHF